MDLRRGNFINVQFMWSYYFVQIRQLAKPVRLFKGDFLKESHHFQKTKIGKAVKRIKQRTMPFVPFFWGAVGNVCLYVLLTQVIFELYGSFKCDVVECCGGCPCVPSFRAF